jgi:hypothetical protein
VQVYAAMDGEVEDAGRDQEAKGDGDDKGYGGRWGPFGEGVEGVGWEVERGGVGVDWDC